MRRIPLSLEIFPRIYIYIYTSDERGSCTATCRINNDQSIRSRRLTGSSGRDRRGGGGRERGGGQWHVDSPGGRSARIMQTFGSDGNNWFSTEVGKGR